MVRAVVVDDSRELRKVIRLLLEFDGAEVVGDTGDGSEALCMIETLLPDVAIIDAHMSGMSGRELIRSVRRLPNSTRLIAYSGDEASLAGALLAGADDAVLKAGDVENLLDAVFAGPRTPCRA